LNHTNLFHLPWMNPDLLLIVLPEANPILYTILVSSLGNSSHASPCMPVHSCNQESQIPNFFWSTKKNMVLTLVTCSGSDGHPQHSWSNSVWDVSSVKILML